MNTLRRSVFCSLMILFFSYGFSQEKTFVKGNGDVITKTYNISGISSVDFTLGVEKWSFRDHRCNLILEQSGKEFVAIKADENLLEIIKFKRNNDDLIIYLPDNYAIRDAEKISVYISSKTFEELEIKGIANVYTKTPIKGKRFSIDVTGVADINLSLEVDNFELDFTGIGEAVFVGKAAKANIEVGGIAKVFASELVCENCTCELSGIGKIYTNPTNAIDAEISGIGKIYYENEPQHIDKDISGIGFLREN